LLFPVLALAQTRPPEDFFHHGAQYYVHGKKPEAVNEIMTGLRIYPTNQLLNGMFQLLQKEEEKQQQQQDQQKQDQEKQQQQKQQDQKQQDQQQQQQQQQEQQQKEQQQQDQQKDQKQGQGRDAKGSEGEQKDDGDKKAVPGEMTPQEAKQLLDSQKGEEKLLPANSKEKPRDPSKPIKDW
jgi:Ca-activated chloride channel family protein